MEFHPGLKWEHNIYKEDFNSKNIFVGAIDRKVYQLEKLQRDLNSKINKAEYQWHNSESNAKYNDILNNMLSEVERTIRKLHDLREEIR